MRFKAHAAENTFRNVFAWNILHVGQWCDAIFLWSTSSLLIIQKYLKNAILTENEENLSYYDHVYNFWIKVIFWTAYKVNVWVVYINKNLINIWKMEVCQIKVSATNMQ